MALPYQTSVPTAGATVTPADWCGAMLLNPAGTLATLTVQLPKQPRDGQQFVVNTTQVVTALTLQVQASSGHTVLAAATSLAIGVAKGWIFNAATSTWYPC